MIRPARFPTAQALTFVEYEQLVDEVMAIRQVVSPGKAVLLILDNYDSFTYNLVQYFGELGCSSIVRRNDAISVDEIAD
jgi:hypothetical protein